ncbi:STAS domain-containing protein [Virgibacillus kekensis]|uniref:STAS domain-containing protein n=1 Tax=Virgibacillus kekensis TaxID=202261 RepID=A0ABV9DHE5_9BACI
MEEMIKVEKVRNGSECVLFVNGVLDYATMDPFVEHIRAVEDGTTKVTINFKELEFIDSTGIGAIINLAHEANTRHFSVELEGVDEETHELFETIGVYQILSALEEEGE